MMTTTAKERLGEKKNQEREIGGRNEKYERGAIEGGEEVRT